MLGLLTGADAALERLVRVVLGDTRPELILLFGSRAWGKPRDDSDYDLMLVLATPDMVKPARDGTSKTGAVERMSGGTDERWNGGTVERWNATREAERHTGLSLVCRSRSTVPPFHRSTVPPFYR